MGKPPGVVDIGSSGKLYPKNSIVNIPVCKRMLFSVFTTRGR